MRLHLTPTFNNVEEEQGDEFALRIQQNQMLLVNCGARGFKRLRFHVYRLEAYNKDLLLFGSCGVTLDHASRYPSVQRRDNPPFEVAFTQKFVSMTAQRMATKGPLVC